MLVRISWTFLTHKKRKMERTWWRSEAAGGAEVGLTSLSPKLFDVLLTSVAKQRSTRVCTKNSPTSAFMLFIINYIVSMLKLTM